MEKATAFIQYKGTDICFDFTCLCGSQGHFDGFFAHYVKCSACGSVYAMPVDLELVQVTESEAHVKPVVPASDDDS